MVFWVHDSQFNLFEGTVKSEQKLVDLHYGVAKIYFMLAHK